MNMQFPPDIRSKLDAFLASGYYHTEEEVIINALDSLEQEMSLQQAIQQGLEDEAAGNTIPAREMLARARGRINTAS